MYSTNPTERQLTELDYVRLLRLGAGSMPQALAEGLTLAEVLPSRDISPDIVTMYSQVEIVAQDSGLKQKITLCYPADAEPGAGFVSVLSPIGTALLGLRVGGSATWDTPHGESRTAQVHAMLFQPEASGDYTT